jgi:hypothetical protein
MNSENQTHLEHDFAQDEFAQEKSPVHHHQGKLKNQHHKKGNWNFIFLQISRDSTISLLRLENIEIFSPKNLHRGNKKLTPNDANPKMTTMKLKKSHMNMNAYTSAVTLLLGSSSWAKK